MRTGTGARQPLAWPRPIGEGSDLAGRKGPRPDRAKLVDGSEAVGVEDPVEMIDLVLQDLGTGTLGSELHRPPLKVLGPEGPGP